jgi:hypothetical protein
MNQYSLVDYPSYGSKYGLYKAKSPKRAASKAFSQLIRKSNNRINNNSKNFLVFTIKNLHTNKNYTYAGTRILLKNPTTRILPNNKPIIHKYKNIILMEKNLH